MKQMRRKGLVPLVAASMLWLPSVGCQREASDAERIARMAMSTASIWMMEHHEHEIIEGLEKGDLEEALHETEELIGWMEGTPWLPELAGAAREATTAVRTVAVELNAGSRTGADAAIEIMKKKFHHVHHELMETVAEQAEGEGNGD